MQDRGNPGPESRFFSGLFVRGAGGTENFCLRQRVAFDLAGRFPADEVALSVVVFRLFFCFPPFGYFSGALPRAPTVQWGLYLPQGPPMTSLAASLLAR